jgi:hypothetical protein
VVSVKAISGKQNVIVWPNPVRNILNIRLPDTDNKINSVLLYHNQGELIYSEKVNGASYQLNMNHLPAGFYLLEIRLTDQTIFYKTVKQ